MTRVNCTLYCSTLSTASGATNVTATGHQLPMRFQPKCAINKAKYVHDWRRTLRAERVGEFIEAREDASCKCIPFEEMRPSRMNETCSGFRDTRYSCLIPPEITSQMVKTVAPESTDENTKRLISTSMCTSNIHTSIRWQRSLASVTIILGKLNARERFCSSSQSK